MPHKQYSMLMKEISTFRLCFITYYFSKCPLGRYPVTCAENICQRRQCPGKWTLNSQCNSLLAFLWKVITVCGKY